MTENFENTWSGIADIVRKIKNKHIVTALKHNIILKSKQIFDENLLLKCLNTRYLTLKY